MQQPRNEKKKKHYDLCCETGCKEMRKMSCREICLLYCINVALWRGWRAWPLVCLLYVDGGLLLCGRNTMSVPLQRQTVTQKDRKDALASLHSARFRSGRFVQGDSSGQGDTDRNNTINQTRLSLKSLFLWVANLLPEGTGWRHGSW